MLLAYDKVLGKIGFFLARQRPLVLLLLSIIFFVASCLGFIRINVEQPSSKQFIMTGSQSRLDLQHAVQFFPLLDSRQEQIILVPKRNKNILDNECLKEAKIVHQAVLNISDYRNLCFKQPQPTSNTKISNKQKCAVSNPLELAGDNFEHLSNLSLILAREKYYPKTILSDGQSLQTSYMQMLGNFHVDDSTNPPAGQAEALRITYFIRKSTNEEENQKVLDFETTFEMKILSINNRLNCASLFYKSGKAMDDALQQNL